jgi:polyisoprenoid-binding protein YceI
VRARGGAGPRSRSAGGDESSLEGAIGVASADTGDEDRDAHLSAPDFFDAERFPRARFVATRIDPERVVGELTLKGVTREIELDASWAGSGTDPWGNERIGLELEGEIDRTEYGLVWNQPLPTGGFLVDDRVKLLASFSLVKA